MRQLSFYLVEKLIEYEVIQEENKEVYLYGVELILNCGLSTLCILSIGTVLGKPLLAVVFIVGMMQLRHYTGGYHADQYISCFLLSVGSFIISYLVSNWKQLWQLKGSLTIISLVCSTYLWIKGPVDSVKNPKTKQEMKIRKRWTRFYTALYSLIGCVLLSHTMRYVDIATMIICTQISAGAGVLVVRIKGEE